MDGFTITPIGHVRCEDKREDLGPEYIDERKGREAILEIVPEYAEGFQDIENFTHVYVLFIFHRSGHANLIAHPPGDGRPHGVFATRSPHRPNGIGLTVVRLLRHEGDRLFVSGADMIDGTPIIDIKPYTHGDIVTEAKGSWVGHKD